MSASVISEPHERWAEDVIEGELGYSRNGKRETVYRPYPKQNAFHRSYTKHRLLGGAAGPGKTLSLIMDHLMACYEFTDPEEAKQVHTLLLRRTHPKLEATLITRFREKVPKELYKDFNESKKVVTWLNGSTTHFGSMQYEHDAYGWQGQWYRIGYDELAEFTFKQWAATSAWNRCPVSPYCTKDGASNPIGPGAGWAKSLFVDKVPCDEMDQTQRAAYNPEDYEYFPCTYRDNPVFANDPTFLKNLEQYPKSEAEALRDGKWGVAGGYFSGAWDEAENVYDDEAHVIQPWHKRWIGGDWGHAHWAANYLFTMDDNSIIRVYREIVVNQLSPAELAEHIVRQCYDPDGKLPHFERFMYSHDAFHQKYDANTVAVQMNAVLRRYEGFPGVQNAGTDKVGREQLFSQMLKNRVQIGEGYDDSTGKPFPIRTAQLQIARSCRRLIQAIPLAPREEGTMLGEEKIAQFPSLDMIDGCGHGLYGMARVPADKPYHVRLAERLNPLPIEGTSRFIAHLEFNKKEREQKTDVFYVGRRPRRR